MNMLDGLVFFSFVHHDAVHHWTCLRPIKDFGNLLQTMTLCLREEEPGDDIDCNQNAAEHNVVVPTNVVERDRIHKGQDDQRTINGQHFHRQSLCTKRIRKDFGAVAEEKWSVCNVVVEELMRC